MHYNMNEDAHAIYTQENGQSFRLSDGCPVTTPPMSFAYYNRLATTVIAERDGVREFVHAYNAKNLHTVKLCMLGPGTPGRNGV